LSLFVSFPMLYNLILRNAPITDFVSVHDNDLSWNFYFSRNLNDRLIDDLSSFMEVLVFAKISSDLNSKVYG